MAIKDHGPIKNWEVDSDNTKAFVDKYMIPYLRVAKVCGGESTGVCEFKAASPGNKNSPTNFGSSNYKIILEDGTSLCLRAYVQDASKSGSSVIIHRSYVRVLIDINGNKPPNIYGKDVFYYIYYVDADMTEWGYSNYSGTFRPYDNGRYDRDGYKSYCEAQGSGAGCAGLIMIDNWQIKDDYPW